MGIKVFKGDNETELTATSCLYCKHLGRDQFEQSKSYFWPCLNPAMNAPDLMALYESSPDAFKQIPASDTPFMQVVPWFTCQNFEKRKDAEA